jgi:electron transfer flavoprotein beta subunit
MNIVVCLKQVPGTTKIKINPQTNTLIRQGEQNITNPFDTYALEEGIRLKEKYGGEVTAISMGPPHAETMLREAISLGADKVILLSDPAFAGADTWATSYTLSQGINKIHSYDLIICGRQTIDGDTGQVSPELAEIMDIPFIAYVNMVEEISNQQIRVTRMVEEGHEVIETSLPAVISVVKDINVPRLPSLRGIARSKKAVVPIWNTKDIHVTKDEVGLAGSFTSVIKVFFPQQDRMGEMLEGSVEQQVDQLLSKLKKSRVI